MLYLLYWRLREIPSRIKQAPIHFKVLSRNNLRRMIFIKPVTGTLLIGSVPLGVEGHFDYLSNGGRIESCQNWRWFGHQPHGGFRLVGTYNRHASSNSFGGYTTKTRQC